jgi:eukaryotic-like serine/threonine-protein kinase
MSSTADFGITSLIEQSCDLFEADWRAGRRPAIETFLTVVPMTEHGKLLRELLELEVQSRLRAGERPEVSEYLPRFPGHQDVVQAVFFKPPPAVPCTQTDTDVRAIQLSLTVIDGPEKGRVFAFSGHDYFLAGRSKQAALHLSDAYLGRYHFLVEVNPPQCRLTELSSRNGTLVNNQRVQSADLRDGDEIRAGRTALKVSIVAPDALDAPVTSAAEAVTVDLPGALPSTDFESTLPPQAIPAKEVMTVKSTDLPAAAFTGKPATPPRAMEQFSLPGYEFVAELGRGGMGAVYRAKRLLDGKTVAVKAVVPAVAANPRQLQRFLREAIILCQLRHPNIVAFHELLQAQGRPFIVMDFVQGKDAAKILQQRGPLPVRTAVRMMLPVLAALEYAHARRFVHRDIKPGNVLIAEGEGGKTVKLTDFGLARVYQESRLSGLSMQGDYGGTLAFIPPEQITAFRQVEPPADQYSAAATLYNLLTSKFIFDQCGLDSFTKVLQEKPVPLLERRADIPGQLGDIIHKALEKNPSDRHPTIKAFRAALRPFAQ